MTPYLVTVEVGWGPFLTFLQQSGFLSSAPPQGLVHPTPSLVPTQYLGSQWKANRYLLCDKLGVAQKKCLCSEGVIKHRRGKENYFPALGNLADVLFALINSLELPPGTTAIV